MRYFRIGEFAKFCGVTVPFLKFYDKEGLISPIWKDDAGYRYYGDYQMVHFAELYRLSRMGFSTKDAKKLHSEASIDQLRDSLSERRESLIQEIRDQQIALSQLEKLLSAAQYTTRTDSWSIEPMDDAWFCYQRTAPAAGTAGAWWKTAHMLPEIWHRTEWLAPSNPIQGDPPSRQIWGNLITDRELAHSEHFRITAEIPASRCFVHYHSIAAEFEESSPEFDNHIWSCKESLSVLKAHNFTPRGDIYQQRLFVTHEENGLLVHIQTRIPLK